MVSTRREPGADVESHGFNVGADEYALISWPLASRSQSVAVASCTPAEREVLTLVYAGASNAAIARARGTSVRTVANQLASLMRKLSVSSRYELIALHARS